MTIEQMIIACIISDGGVDTMPKCQSAQLSPQMFGKNLSAVYAAVLELYADGKRIDEVSLMKKGVDTIHIMLDPVDNPSWVVQQYIDLLLDQHKGNLLKQGIARASAFIEDDEPDQAIEHIEKSIKEYQGIGTEESTEEIGAVAERVNKELMERLGGKPPELYNTQYYCMNTRFGGFARKNLYVLGGLPGTGKTALALNLASYLSGRHELHGLFFSMEMTKEQCVDRMYCSRCEIDSQRYRDGIISDEQQVNLALQAQKIGTLPLRIDDSGGLDINNIESRVQRRKNRGQLDYIVIDHLHIMSMEKYRQTAEGIADTVRRLKALSKKHGIFVILLIQLNRNTEKENRDPRQSDALGGSGIEHNADVMMLLRRVDSDEPTEDPNRITIRNCFVKNRHGATGNDLMAFRQNILKYENY